MLISRRREGETVLLGDHIEIRIVSVRKKKVILGIIAPRDVRISTARLSEAELENTMAAANAVELSDIASAAREPIRFLLETPQDSEDPPICHLENQDE